MEEIKYNFGIYIASVSLIIYGGQVQAICISLADTFSNPPRLY